MKIDQNRPVSQSQSISNTTQQSRRSTILENKNKVVIESENGENVAVNAENERVTNAGSVDEAKLEEDVLKKSIDQANQSLKQFDREIIREVHEKTKTLMYKIKDIKTGEVIAEFPPKKLQDMIAKMWELAGLFIDEKA